MYSALQIGGLGLGVLLLVLGVRSGRRGLVALGPLIAVATLAFFAVLDLWTEALWFEALGHAPRFWIATGARVVALAGAGAAGAAAVLVLTWPVRKRGGKAVRWVRRGAAGLGALIGAGWGLAHWDTVLLWWNRVPTTWVDPILERPVGFYLFTLPLYDALYQLALALAVVSLLAALGAMAPAVVRRSQGGEQDSRLERGLGAAVPLTTAALLLVVAGGLLLDRYHLLISSGGAVWGAGWTDVRVRLPALTATAALIVLVTLGMVLPPVRRRAGAVVGTLTRQEDHQLLAAPLGAVALVAILWALLVALLPAAVQWLRVQPNEITLEQPYLRHNIDMTRLAFGLRDAAEREFPAAERFDRAMVDANPAIFDNVRLWDWRALDAVYEQFQEIRLYYEFVDVDIDRYEIDGQLREVMVSAREMQVSNLPQQSQTFVNRHFKYTHGYGATMAPVSRFTQNGLPDLLIRDIPPVAAHPQLEVTRPGIYYGELPGDFVVVNSEEKEFDYPRGENNVYVHYEGQGGVPLDGAWRRFLFGYRHGGTRLLLSSYPREGSRIQLRRQVRRRVAALAPFLQLEDDPYLVLVDGELHWIVDAYTTSDRFPYSEPYDSYETIGYKEGDADRTLHARTAPHLHGASYVRNSVKAVVDAYDGTVDLYVYEPDDPLIQAWRGIYPDLFRDRAEMPPALQAHVRYPVGLLLAQGLVYAKYHMTDPAVFYNQEDLWVRATETYYGDVRPVEPYYVIWEPPASDHPQFALILPFTPKDRQVLIGWISGLCDGEDYGRMVTYQFPKERRTLGPQQVETKIDQDRELSGQLTLWDQRGSSVIRGNVLAIPVEDTLVYVEPIYLQAETAAYPELRLVAIMHGDELSYAPSFEEALRGLLGEQAPEAERPAAVAEAGPSDDLGVHIERASAAFGDYLEALGDRRYEDSSAALGRLSTALRRLRELDAGAAAGEPASGTAPRRDRPGPDGIGAGS